MSHRFKKQPASTQIYRHFAVVTVMLTGLLVLFADGENAKAVAQRVEQQKQHKQQAQAEEKQAVPTPPQQPGGVWGNSGGSSAAVSAGHIFARSGALASDRALSAAGYGTDYLSRLARDDRAHLAEAASANLNGVEARKSALEAASRMRSGSVGLE